MTLSHSCRVQRSVFLGLLGLLLIVSGSLAEKQPTNQAPPSRKPEAILQPKPRPKRPDLPPSQLPLTFIKGERIALLGNSLAERMNLFGSFESLLHSRFPNQELVVRNFGRPAEEVGIQQRSADYTKLDDPLFAFGADTFLCFFGFNESFAGPEGITSFQAAYERFLDDYARKYPRDDTKAKPRFVLIAPIAFEPTGQPFLPDGTKENANLKRYSEAIAAVAKKRNLAFVDLFTPTLPLFSKEPGLQYTINGCHLNEAGDMAVSRILDEALFGSPTPAQIDSPGFAKLRKAVNDKSWVHQQDHRMVNGWYVYGGRRTFDRETFPLEYVKIRNMVAVRDRYVWDIARGKEVAAQPDDSGTGDLYIPPTRFGDPKQKYSEASELRYLSPSEFIQATKVPPGFELKLFADEKQFPDLINPVQLNFDNKGRLWVACMPNYPQWKPGEPRPGDKLLILEDTDGDGKADICKVFYDQLHCPTGFEFWNGGVLVVDQPRMLWLKDTNGDDKADQIVHLFDGWATDDTHHTLGAFEWSPGGKLHMLEGIATSTTVETPYGPHRSHGTGGCYVLDPRTLKLEQFALPGQYNSWCYVFDEWGQGIVGDGTTANTHWETPLSGAQFNGRVGLNTIFDQEGMRPAIGSEFLVSRHFPKDVQKQYIYACVINMNGIPRFEFSDDGAGFKGQRLKANKQPDDLLRSSDKHFRPADPQMGPDGALWFGDWSNALIGHMQYSQRDPNRDRQHGRIYRLVHQKTPLIKPVTQAGKSIAELLDQLREYEWRTRYRARRELWDRPANDVQAALTKWLAALKIDDPDYDRLRCEALWLQQSHHMVDAALLKDVLQAKDFRARAAATHVLAEERHRVPNAWELLREKVLDEHPRVRTEAIRGLSFFPTLEAAKAILAAAKLPMDYWTRYTLQHALGANHRVWQSAYLSGQLTKDNPEGEKVVAEIVASFKIGGVAAPHLRVLLSSEPQSPELRNKAMTALATMRGNPTNGREVFRRGCITCHKIGMGEGQDYGPNLAQVGMRLPRLKIIESIVDPNAEVDKKYLSTRIDKSDGKTIIGLVVSETKDQVVIFDGKEKQTIAVKDIEERTQLKQSSMPEGLAATMAPSEFLDLVEYLANLK